MSGGMALSVMRLAPAILAFSQRHQLMAWRWRLINQRRWRRRQHQQLENRNGVRIGGVISILAASAAWQSA